MQGQPQRNLRTPVEPLWLAKARSETSTEKAAFARLGEKGRRVLRSARPQLRHGLNREG